jgi:hypothetical protein
MRRGLPQEEAEAAEQKGGYYIVTHCVLRHPLQTDGGADARAEERWARKSQRAGCQSLARKGNAGQHNHGISQDEGRRECGRVPCRDPTEHREQRRQPPRCRLALWRPPMRASANIEDKTVSVGQDAAYGDSPA